jgi:phytoene desaturase
MDKLRVIIKPIDRSIFSHPYDRFWQLLDPNLMSMALRFDVRKSYRELVDSFFTSPLLKAFFYGFPSYGGQTYDSKAAGALLIPYLMLDEGVFYPEGGVSSIPAAFYKLAVELGVELRFGAKVRSLESDGRRVKSIILDSGERLEAETVISNVDRLTTRSWLGHTVDWKPSLSYFTVHWGIKKRLPGLSHHTLLVPDAFQSGFEQLYRDSVFPDKPIVYLNATAIEDDQVAPPGCENLFAVITSPAKESHLDWERDRDRYVTQTRQSICEFGFEWDDAEIEFERVQTPNYFEERHGNYLGSLYGPHERHRLFGILPLRNYDEDYPNLFYCGGSVQPGAGLPMVTLSGRFAAQAATKR